jgi:hypothetical protein
MLVVLITRLPPHFGRGYWGLVVVAVVVVVVVVVVVDISGAWT